MEELRDASQEGNNALYPVEGSWIIIDKDMLLREVNGSVFAPDDFTEYKELTRTGIVFHNI